MEPLFDLSEEYNDMLNKGLKLSGESKEYFLHGRIRHLLKSLPVNLQINDILDFGCGTGDTSFALGEYFKKASITAADLSKDALDYAKLKFNNNRIEFINLSNIKNNSFDLVYMNGVFHHIPLNLRDTALKQIYDSLKSGGIFAFFENNPWNPGTSIIMNRIPFDRDAKTINFLKAKKMLLQNGFSKISSINFLFYFPRQLKFFRRFEKRLNLLPLGAQYCILARKL